MCEKTRMYGVTFIHQCFRRNLVNTDRINSIQIPYKLIGVDEYLNIGIPQSPLTHEICIWCIKIFRICIFKSMNCYIEYNIRLK